MKLQHGDDLNLGTRLTVTYALLIALILGGNGLIVWQFNSARTQADRLASANQQLIVVLQLQVDLLSFHQRLDELARSRQSQRMVAEAGPLRRTLHEETQRTRSALAALPSGTRVDPAFWPTLEVIEIMLPGQLDAITELARTDDWAAVQLRLGNQLKPIETQMATLVDSVGRQTSRELAQSVERMRTAQRGIFLLVPATAICSFLIAAFFGWSIARRIAELRLEERLTERMRIARDLHDTLLQSFQASLVQMQAASNLFRRRPEQALQNLDSAIKMAAGAIAEGRGAIQQLRGQPADQSDLSLLMSVTGQELARSCDTSGTAVTFRVVVEGDKKELKPLVQDEVYRIVRELLRNAFQHARASQIEAKIQYERRRLRVHVRDDGKGIDTEILKRGGRPGHWGLAGMSERAKRIDARLDFRSELGRGTEVQLTVPASVAYQVLHKAAGFRIY